MQLSLRLAHLYPDHMNIYGDRGNILTLVQRCRWRGIGIEVVPVRAGDAVDWLACDLVFLAAAKTAAKG
jgi:lipid II isoglutaminyl synthase (glutamine-hydrolysing)